MLKFCFIFQALLYFSSSFPIEIKEIQNLFPPQNTFLQLNGEYETKPDRQLGEEEEIKKGCIPKQQSVPENSENATETILSQDDGNGFVDNSPINGTVVDDPMEIKIYKPECDD